MSRMFNAREGIGTTPSAWLRLRRISALNTPKDPPLGLSKNSVSLLLAGRARMGRAFPPAEDRSSTDATKKGFRA